MSELARQKYVTTIYRGRWRQQPKVVVTTSELGVTFEFLAPGTKAPADAQKVKSSPATAPAWPRDQVLAHKVTPARQEQVLTSPVWAAFAERTRRSGVCFVAGRVAVGNAMELRAATTDKYDPIRERRPLTVQDTELPTYPAQIAAAIFNIAAASTPTVAVQGPRALL